MSDRNQIRRPIDMLTFALAGNATFTLVGKQSRFTYRVRQSEDGKVYFVSILTGSDNETNYQYAGIIPNQDGADFRVTAKSRFSNDTPSVRAFRWFWSALRAKDEEKLGQMEFWHEGRCGRCHRKLTVPESIERGIGPECAGIMGLTIKPATPAPAPATQPEFDDFNDPIDDVLPPGKRSLTELANIISG